MYANNALIQKKIQKTYGDFIITELILQALYIQVRSNKSLHPTRNVSHTYVHSLTSKEEQLNSIALQIIRFYFAKTLFTKILETYTLIAIIKMILLLTNFVHMKVNLQQMVTLHISKATSTVQSSKVQFVMEGTVL